MHILKIILPIFFLTFTYALAAQNPSPAPPQEKNTCIIGATAHLGNGKVIANSFIAFAKGKITHVTNYDEQMDLSTYKVILAKGKHVYPGFIAMNTNLGLIEIGAVRSTRDEKEIGHFNPNIRSIIAFNTDSEVIPTIRNHGILSAQICPQGGRISGSSSLVHLDGWNWEDAVLSTDEGIHLHWPARFSYNWTSYTLAKNAKYSKQLDNIEDTFTQAKAYSKKEQPSVQNLKFEAMKGLFTQKQRLYVHVDEAKSIMQAILFAKKMNVKIVLVGAKDAWRVVDMLKENETPVILHKTQNLPQRAGENIDQPFTTPAALEDAGILYAISMNGYWQQRNLPFQAGQAVGFGLAYEKAVEAITLNPARILGVDKQMGSIEIGKDATLFISEGDALDMKSSTVQRAFIQGRDINLSDKQKVLYEKFKTKK